MIPRPDVDRGEDRRTPPQHDGRPIECGICIFWHRPIGATDPIGGCNAHPPYIVVIDREIMSRWPRTLRHHWCGDFVAAPPEE